jgi:hypothetical protein
MALGISPAALQIGNYNKGHGTDAEAGTHMWFEIFKSAVIPASLR